MTHPPVLGFVAYSGTGKTTLLERLIPELRARGLRLAVIKHAHHDFDIDHPGKDSHRLRQAGAGAVLVASRRRWALIHENDDERPEPRLAELLAHIDPARVDLVLVEGFKHERYAKVELWRAELGKPFLWPDDDTIVAVASDVPLPQCPLPRLDLADVAGIAEYVSGKLSEIRGEPAP